MNKNALRNILLIFIAIILIILPGCFNSDSGPGDTAGNAVNPGSESEKEETLQNLVRCPLSGDMAPEGTTDRRPLAIMVENAPAARPQSGLDKADVIYEILAEGAITRFLAIYLHGDAGEIGPVRSARPYYIERMFEYDAIYAFCGGSPAALEMVRREKVASLDEFGVGRQAYWRIKGRKAPHNLYTDTEKLRMAGSKRGYGKEPRLPDFRFLSEGEENPGGVSVDNVTINYPLSSSTVRWNFDHDIKGYRRYQGGTAHKDAVTGKQLTGSNILIQYVNTKIVDDEGRRDISMIGKGRAFMMSGGELYEGTWSKKSMRAQTHFYGEDGSEFMLNPGQTWIQVVPAGAKVVFK